MEHQILRLTDVKAMTGLSSSTIYLRMAEGKFPKKNKPWFKGRGLDQD